jgi:hypothetical protein
MVAPLEIDSIAYLDLFGFTPKGSFGFDWRDRFCVRFKTTVGSFFKSADGALFSTAVKAHPSLRSLYQHDHASMLWAAFRCAMTFPDQRYRGLKLGNGSDYDIDHCSVLPQRAIHLGIYQNNG